MKATITVIYNYEVLQESSNMLVTIGLTILIQMIATIEGKSEYRCTYLYNIYVHSNSP